ncbi:MAG: hypothetical protein O9331_20155 [Acidovorax sp.]|nr:hypothetical protein [Acidovorax sp.]
MDSEQLFRAIASHFGKPLPREAGALPPERAEQYLNALGPQALEEVREKIGELSPGHAFDSIIGERLKRIIKANPGLAGLVSGVTVQGIDTVSEATKTIKMPNGQSLILLDSHTMLFLWMMNKSFIYGQSRLSEEDNENLYFEIFLHFATLRHAKAAGGVYPRPKTPKHVDELEMGMLYLFTDIQETFLLCHELAHAFIGSNPRLPDTLISTTDFPLSHKSLFPSNTGIDLELLADELALEWTLNTGKIDMPESVEVICTAVFLLIRYFMWLRIVHTEAEQDTEFQLWLARNNLLRAKFWHVYHWAPPTFIVDLFEHLESVMEPASLKAGVVFRKLALEQTKMP